VHPRLLVVTLQNCEIGDRYRSDVSKVVHERVLPLQG
jgi:hypothetical protein